MSEEYAGGSIGRGAVVNVIGQTERTEQLIRKRNNRRRMAGEQVDQQLNGEVPDHLLRALEALSECGLHCPRNGRQEPAK